tara:strand:- start:1194 stop:1313 length:120 start_codon:yes stop_codon:yes gene_type:complete
MEKITLVDKAWTCGCGSLNAHHRETCGGCNQVKLECNEE